MGLLSKMEAIHKINNLLKMAETNATSIINEADAQYPNVDKIKANADVICILMGEACDIANSAGEEVNNTSYSFYGEKRSFREITMMLAELVKMCNDLYMESFKESLKCY